MHLKISSGKWRPFCHGLNVCVCVCVCVGGGGGGGGGTIFLTNVELLTTFHNCLYVAQSYKNWSISWWFSPKMNVSNTYESGHEGAAVLLPGFAIIW